MDPVLDHDADEQNGLGGGRCGGAKTGELVLGIDGGGSKTLVVLLDRYGALVRSVSASGVNPLDNPNWEAELGEALRPFANMQGLVAIAAGLPAHGEVEAISEAQRRAIAQYVPNTNQLVLNDVDAAQIGAFGGRPGILLLSGTGSMAWARDRLGRSYRVGGWGDVVGDEGSSYWIGLRVLSLVSQSLDGRASPTALAEAIFTHLGLDIANPTDSLEGWVSQLAHQRSEIARLAPFATRLAEAGDAGARAIVSAAALELARHVPAIERHVGAGVPWSYAGGTFASGFLLAAVVERLGRPPVPPRLPPVGGALLAAARLADWAVDDAWIDRLAAALRLASIDEQELQLTTT